MKIESIEMQILESDPVVPEWRPLRTMREYPGSHKVRFGHRLFDGDGIQQQARPGYACVLRIRTDANIETCGVFSTSWGLPHLEWEARTFKLQWEPELVGVDALNREYMWQKMWMARRYFHMTSTAPIALIDTLLWDLAGHRANLPVHKLIGGFRDRVPAYLTETGIPYEDTLKTAQRAVDEGFKGFKDHSMLGVETNLDLAKAIRDLVGDEMVLMHDPVQQYSVEDAIKVGRGLEELDYLWIEEPLQEFDINGLKRLSDAIDLPVMALESIPGNPYLATPYLVADAIDIVRQTGLGITGQIKLANLVEMFGKNCHGGNPHVVAAIRNDDWWEVAAWPPTGKDRSLEAAFAGLIRDTTEVKDGYMYVPQTAGLGREIDWEQIEERTVLKV
jgi:L-alanine-DL-glutamate epimerase-like enolase superfamily enzyme